MSTEAIQPIDLAQLFESSSKHVHPALAEPGFTMPRRGDLDVYDLDDAGQRATIAERHGLKLTIVGDASRNQLAVHRELRAPKLALTFKGTGSVCVLGPNACVTGSITLTDRTTVVIAGGTKPRALVLELVFFSRDQRFFWGRGSSAEGASTSVRGDGVAIVVGDDCMFSWRVWLRPADMHLIVDLASHRVLNTPEDIVVEPHVWVGQEALILKGARIGAGTVIGAKSLVPRGKYDRMSIYGGNPVRKLRAGVSWDREHVLTPEVIDRVRAIQAAYPGSDLDGLESSRRPAGMSARIVDGFRAAARALRSKLSGR